MYVTFKLYEFLITSLSFRKRIYHFLRTFFAPPLVNDLSINHSHSIHFLNAKFVLY